MGRHESPVGAIQEVAWHRNGISGEPFYVVRFTLDEPDSPFHGHPMVGLVFKETYHVAVLDVTQLAAGNIAFAGGNSWRGDNFEPALRDAIKAREETAARLVTSRQPSGGPDERRPMP